VKQPIVKGHPLHAMASDLPAAGLVISYLFDVLSRTAATAAEAPSVEAVGGGISHVLSEATRRQTRFRDVATSTLTAAVGGGALAGAFGWWDFLNIPAHHPARAPALLHGLLNSGLLTLGGANLLTRRGQDRWGRTAAVPFALSTAGIGVLLASAWIGGDLVYRLGWRVRPAEQLEILEPELEKAGQGGLAQSARQQVERYEKDSALIP
jgi:uncharacterized membrane protein